jgi:hypothetical protein
MRNRSPIYNMLDQEIKACAAHLLEMSQKLEFSAEKDGEHALVKLNELHKFATRVREGSHYHPLNELKTYLENRMVRFVDEQKSLHSMRLSEVISLLGIPAQDDMQFKPEIVSSLLNHFVRLFLEEIKPGRPLFRKLIEIKKL